jgi:CheY-like chemotaxis protein
MDTAIRVYLVGGETPLADVIAGLLQRSGHEVKFVFHLALAAEARRSLPDVIFINIGTSSFDGTALASRMRRRPAFAAVPLVAFTEDASPQARAAALEAGFVGYLIHPLTAETLDRVIEQVRDSIYIPRRLADWSERLIDRFNRAHPARSRPSAEEPIRDTPVSSLSMPKLPVAVFESAREPAESVLPLFAQLDCAVSRFELPEEFVRCMSRLRPGLVVLNGGRSPYIAYDLARRIFTTTDPGERLVIRVSHAAMMIQEPLAAEVGIASQLVRPLRVEQLEQTVRLAEVRWQTARAARGTAIGV